MKRPLANDRISLDLALRKSSYLRELDVEPDQNGELWDQLLTAFAHRWLDDEDELADELAQVLNASPMDRDDLVDLIDSVIGETYAIENARQKEWVHENAIEPLLAEGAQVKLPQSGKTYDGVVVKVNEMTGHYTVRVPSLGHVEKGVGTHGFVVPFETLHPIVAPPERFELRSPWVGESKA